MTLDKETILALANAAMDEDKVPAWQNGFWTITHEELERFAHLIRNATLEEAAKECTNTASRLGSSGWFEEYCATAIRALGKE